MDSTSAAPWRIRLELSTHSIVGGGVTSHVSVTGAELSGSRRPSALETVLITSIHTSIIVNRPILFVTHDISGKLQMVQL